MKLKYLRSITTTTWDFSNHISVIFSKRQRQEFRRCSGKRNVRTKNKIKIFFLHIPLLHSALDYAMSSFPPQVLYTKNFESTNLRNKFAFFFYFWIFYFHFLTSLLYIRNNVLHLQFENLQETKQPVAKSKLVHSICMYTYYYDSVYNNQSVEKG